MAGSLQPGALFPPRGDARSVQPRAEPGVWTNPFAQRAGHKDDPRSWKMPPLTPRPHLRPQPSTPQPAPVTVPSKRPLARLLSLPSLPSQSSRLARSAPTPNIRQQARTTPIVQDASSLDDDISDDEGCDQPLQLHTPTAHMPGGQTTPSACPPTSTPSTSTTPPGGPAQHGTTTPSAYPATATPSAPFTSTSPPGGPAQHETTPSACLPTATPSSRSTSTNPHGGLAQHETTPSACPAPATPSAGSASTPPPGGLAQHETTPSACPATSKRCACSASGSLPGGPGQHQMTTPSACSASCLGGCGTKTPSACSTTVTELSRVEGAHGSKRNVLALKLSLAASQMGDPRQIRAGARSTSRYDGLYRKRVARVVAREEAEANELHVKFGILGALLPTEDTMRNALLNEELRHLQLRLKRVLASLPLVETVCDVLVESGSYVESPREVHVLMHRPSFERALSNGCCFVVFAPWLAMKNDSVVLAQHCEPLSSPISVLESSIGASHGTMGGTTTLEHRCDGPF